MHPDDVKAIDAYTEIVRREAAKDAEIARLQEQVETMRKELRLVVGQRDFFMKINESNFNRAEAAEAERDRLREALLLTAGALQAGARTMAPEVAFTGEWAHLGRRRVSEILDQAEAALQKEPQP